MCSSDLNAAPDPAYEAGTLRGLRAGHCIFGTGKMCAGNAGIYRRIARRRRVRIGGEMKDRPVIVVENDPFPRLLKAFLDQADDPARTAAIADFVAHDIPDYPGWLAQARAAAPGLYPAEVRLASSQEELHAMLPGAHAVVTETLQIGKIGRAHV